MFWWPWDLANEGWWHPQLYRATATHDLSAQLHTYAQCATRRLFAQNFWQNWAKICGEKWPLYIFLFTSNLLTPAFPVKPIAFQPSKTEAWGQNGKFTTRTFSFTWVGEMLGIFAGIAGGATGTGISPMTLYEPRSALCRHLKWTHKSCNERLAWHLKFIETLSQILNQMNRMYLCKYVSFIFANQWADTTNYVHLHDLIEGSWLWEKEKLFASLCGGG